MEGPEHSKEEATVALQKMGNGGQASGGTLDNGAKLGPG